MTSLILAVALYLHRGTPPPDVVQAIAAAAATPDEAAVATVYAALESDYRPGAVGDGGKSCGVVQMPCWLVRGHDVAWQMATWMRWVRAYGLAAVDSSPSRAKRRLELAREALERQR